MTENSLPSQSFYRKIRSEFLAFLVFLFFLILRSTWKIQEDEFPDEIKERLKNKLPVVVAHFHEDEWALLGAWSKRGAHTLVSLSADGTVMSRFLSLFGWNVSRGSSSKGGASGLIALIRALRKSSNPTVTIAVDGPRGPRRRAKKGALKLAQVLEAPVLAMGASSNKCFIFKKSWSKAFLPLPFSRVKISYSSFLTPTEVIEASKRDDSAEAIFKIEELLKTAKVMAKQSL